VQQQLFFDFSAENFPQVKLTGRTPRDSHLRIIQLTKTALAINSTMQSGQCFLLSFPIGRASFVPSGRAACDTGVRPECAKGGNSAAGQVRASGHATPLGRRSCWLCLARPPRPPLPPCLPWNRRGSRCLPQIRFVGHT
jgi:hypothetical protein